MEGITKYNKAIVAALAAVVATVVAIIREDDPTTIPGSAELIAGAVTTLLVYLVPNTES